MTSDIYNHETVIRAIAKSSAQLRNVYCLFTGFNCVNESQLNYKKSLIDLGVKLGIYDRLRFLNAIPYELMPDYYRLSDVTVSIPRSDAVPATFFEAMACRCPVLCGNLPAYRDIICPDRNAIQVDHLNPDSVAEGLIRVLTNRTLAESFRDEGEKTVLKHGNIEIEMDKLDALYRSLTNTF
jgi:glycosyltransferase involved in cell wall biosynthesis